MAFRWLCICFCWLTAANDCDILAQFGAATTASVQMNWQMSSSDWCCEAARGVTCQNMDVVALDLDSMQIAGSFPSSFANLKNLTSLSAVSNKFDNVFSPSVIFLPPSLNLVNLTDNQFSGRVPSWLINLPHLAKLSLEFNSLTGPLPLITTSTLQLLNIGYNHLNGTLSPLQNITQLAALQLYANHLSGSLDPVAGLTNLQRLDMSGNHLVGTLDPIKNLTRLMSLQVPYNDLVGDISPTKNMNQLQILFLGHNQFVGGLEPIASLTQLESLNVGENDITGTLGPLAKLTNLGSLQLDSNRLTGSLAPLMPLNNLVFLVLLDNKLTGTLEPLADLTSLHWAVLGQNSLSGTLEPLSNLVNLSWIAVQSNFLTGPLDPILNLPRATYVNVSANLLDGAVDLRNLTNLMQFRGLFNNFSGLLAPSASGKFIDVSHNHLSTLQQDYPLPELLIFNVSFNSFIQTFNNLKLSSEHPTLLDIRTNPFLCPYPEISTLVVVARSTCVYNWTSLKILFVAFAAAVGLGAIYLIYKQFCFSKDSLAQACVIYVLLLAVRAVSTVSTGMSLWQMLVYLPAEIADQDSACAAVNNRTVFDLVFTEVFAPPLPGNTLTEYVAAFLRESELPQSSLDINLEEFSRLCSSFPRCGYLGSPIYLCDSIQPPLHQGFAWLVTAASMMFCVAEVAKFAPFPACLAYGEEALTPRASHLFSRSSLAPLMLFVRPRWFVKHVILLRSDPWDYVLELAYVGFPSILFVSLMIYHHLSVLQTDWTGALYLSILSNARNVFTLLFRMRFVCCPKADAEESPVVDARQPLMSRRASSVNG